MAIRPSTRARASPPAAAARADEASAIFPDVVAPGVSITAADNSGSYWSPSGTSLAAPHVAGALALLLDGAPTLGVLDQLGVGDGDADLVADGRQHTQALRAKPVFFAADHGHHAHRLAR